MNTLYQPILASADQVITDATLRNRIITTAVALAIAHSLDLPSSRVEDDASYFGLQVSPSIRSLLSDFNENLVFDVREAAEQVRAFWSLRYNAAYPKRYINLGEGCGFFHNLTGVSTYFSDDKCAFFNANHKAIFQVTVAASDVVAAYKEKNAQ